MTTGSPSIAVVLPQTIELTIVMDPLELSVKPLSLPYNVTFTMTASAVSLRAIPLPLVLSTNTLAISTAPAEIVKPSPELLLTRSKFTELLPPVNSNSPNTDTSSAANALPRICTDLPPLSADPA